MSNVKVRHVTDRLTRLVLLALVYLAMLLGLFGNKLAAHAGTNVYNLYIGQKVSGCNTNGNPNSTGDCHSCING